MQPMIQWQILWIRIIANAWSQDSFRKKLIDKNESVRELVKTEFNEEIPFPKWVKLSVEEAPESKWVPRMHFWTLPCTRLTLRVPHKPSDDQLANTLSDYISLLVQLEAPIQPIGAKPGATDLFGGPESPIPAFETMIRWFTIWPQAVALAWNDSNFATYLQKAPDLALYNAFGFQVPGGVELTVNFTDPNEHKAGSSNSDPTNDNDCVNKDSDSVPHLWPVELVLILPPKPELPSEGAIALGAYSESGRSYPFTLFTC
ncbi:BMA_0021/BMA_0022 family TOMM bacteriocin [Sorangium sp. So ce134]